MLWSNQGNILLSTRLKDGLYNRLILFENQQLREGVCFFQGPRFFSSFVSHNLFTHFYHHLGQLNGFLFYPENNFFFLSNTSNLQTFQNLLGEWIQNFSQGLAALLSTNSLSNTPFTSCTKLFSLEILLFSHEELISIDVKAEILILKALDHFI